MPVFEFRFTVKAPIGEVARFHGATDALRRLTPPPMVVRIHRFGAMAEGMEAEFTLWLGPLPIRWLAVHQDVSERGFTDVQQKGPAAFWKHTHRFTPLSDRLTEIHEHIEYRHKPGWRGLLSRLLFPKPGLRLLFTYRKWATRRALEGTGTGRGVA